MRRLSFILSILSCFSLQAQMGRIPMNVFIPEDVFDAEAISMLDSKLNQIVTNYAVADNSADYRFFMTPTIIVSSKTIVPSAPPKVSQKLELVLFIGDVIDDKLFGSLSIPLIGVGQNDTMAYLNALKKIPVRSKTLESFMGETKDKIVSYYQQNANSIIISAESLAKSGQYDEAIRSLISIPDFCGEVSENVGEAVKRVYQMKIDSEGATLFNRAKTLWDAKQNESAVNEVLDLLNDINPESSSATECAKLISRMNSTLALRKAKAEEKEQAEWEFKMRQYEDQIELQRQQLKDQTSIEKARVETEKSVSGHIGKIDFNKVTRVIKSWTKSGK